MIRVCVVDDEPVARSGVISRLTAHADILVVGEHADGPSALAGLLDLRPDVVFMDVQMPGMDGLEVLQALPASARPLSILLTAHEGFAVRAFGLNAVDYLLKPIDDDRFCEAIARIRERMLFKLMRGADDREARNSDESAIGSNGSAPSGPSPNGSSENMVRTAYATKFSVRIGHRIVFLNASDVEWIGADGDYATLHVGDKSYLLREPLQKLAAKLDPAMFVRVHRSTIVRTDRIAEMQPLTNRDAIVRLQDGTPLRVSRTYIAELLAKLQHMV